MTSTPEEMKPLGTFLRERGYTVFIPLLSGHGTSIAELEKTPASAWLADAERALCKSVALRTAGSDTANSDSAIPHTAIPVPVHVIGASFGSLLALSLACGPLASQIKTVITLGPPFALRSAVTERVLTLLSYLPEWILNRLGTKEKAPRPPGTFSFPRYCYTAHSYGALARMMQIRAQLTGTLRTGRLSALSIPVLIVQDRHDHHLSHRSADRLRALLPPSVAEVVYVDGGEHELVIGTKHREVFAAVAQFLERHSTLTP
jgi:carboxylesterase